MKNFKFEIGTYVWISKFSPDVFDGYDIIDGYIEFPTKKEDIFYPPTRYKITETYQTDGNRDKWFIELTAKPEDSFFHINGYLCLKNVVVSETAGSGTAASKTAALLGHAQIPNNLVFEVKRDWLASGFSEMTNDLIISKKKSKNLAVLSNKMKKLQKKFKFGKQYSKMSLVMSCLVSIKTESQIQQMVKSNPEDFL